MCFLTESVVVVFVVVCVYDILTFVHTYGVAVTQLYCEVLSNVLSTYVP